MRSTSIQRTFFILLFLAGSLFSCDRINRPALGNWNERIPESVVAVYIPLRDEGISQLPSQGYTSLVSVSDVGGTDWQQLFGIGSQSDVRYLAKLLLPVTSTSLAPVWVLDASKVKVEYLRSVRKEVFGQPSYQFKGFRIHRFPLERLDMFASSMGDVTLISTSARAIEKMLASQIDLESAFDVPSSELRPGSVILNGEALDDWAVIAAAALHRPSLENVSNGLGRWILRPALDDSTLAWKMKGSFDVISDTLGALSESISGLNRRIVLDRYVSSRSAAFAITQKRVTIPAKGSIRNPTKADLYLMQESSLLGQLDRAFGLENAFVAFSESGFQGGSESLHIRELLEPGILRSVMNRLASEDLASLRSGIYTVESRILSSMLLGNREQIGPIYVDIVEEAVVASSRPGRTESVREDRRRRNVIRYEPEFVNRVPTSSRGFSFIASVRSEAFLQYIQPWLISGGDHLDFIKQVETLIIKGQREEPQGTVSVEILAIPSKESRNPFRERWTYSLPESALSAPPVLADIGGSAREEVIFSTVNGSIIALATDGTSVLQLSTGQDRPIGSPVIYDWYGNRQNVIMQAAGDKIYAWDRNGKDLPAFPVTLGEQITSPLLVQDLTRNGIPEMVVSTADRKLYLLNSRGVPIPGWPQTTNAVVTTTARVLQNGNQLALAAAAENTIHVWSMDGMLLEGFPIFTDAPVTGTPVQSGSTLLFSTISGHLNASPFSSMGTASAGNFSFFEPTGSDASDATSSSTQSNGGVLATSAVNSPIRTETGQQLFISDLGLTFPPVLRENILYALSANGPEDSESAARQFIREDVLLTGSPNGSLFLHSKKGRLLFTASLGQALSRVTSPSIASLRSSDRLAILAVGEYGRLFAWDLLSGDRLEELPTNGMEFPVVTDLDKDGAQELIALTREGLRCWTLQ